MQFQVLGTFGVRVGDRDSTPTGRLQRALLALLLADPGHPVSSDQLTHSLWPGATDERVAAKLHVLVHRVRGCLDSPDRLTRGPAGYQLLVDTDELDSLQFEALSAAVLSSQAGPTLTVERATEALALWRGPPFEGIDLPELTVVADRWTEMRLSVVEHLYAGDLARGRHRAIVDALGRVALEHPLRERLQALLVTALSASGRQAEALDAYSRTRAALVDELGIEPGPELQELHARILAGESVAANDIAPSPDDRAREWVAPAQLPPGPGDLLGREVELERLEQLLGESAAAGGDERGTSVCVISGMAGAGKTALAVHWAGRHRDDFPDGQLFVDLQGFSAVPAAEPVEVLGTLIRALGGDPAEQASTADARSGLFRTLTAGKRLLLVLDNARSAEQVRPLLPGPGGALVLVTSRESLRGLVVSEGAQPLDLGRLDDRSAHELLARLVGDWVLDDRAGCAALVRSCGSLPLALRIVAEQVRIRPRAEFADIVEEIADEEGRLDLLDIGDGARTDIRAVFSWSYDLLPDDAAQLFRVLGLLPGRSADARSIAALADLEPRQARRLLRVLACANLVDVLPRPRYAQHDLLRDYAAELSQRIATPQAIADARSRLLAQYARASAAAIRWIARPTSEEEDPESGVGDLATAVAWVEDEHQNVLSAVDLAGINDYRHVIELGRNLGEHLLDRGHPQEALRLREAARNSARAVGDRVAEADAESGIGTLHGQSGDLDRAERHIARALHLHRANGSRVGESRALNNLGVLAAMRGQLHESVALYLSAVELNRAERRFAEAAIELSNVATYYMWLGDDALAFDYFEQVVALERDSGGHKALGLALCGLGRIHQQRGDFAAAVECAQEALSVGRSAGHLLVEGFAHQVIGAVHLRAGRTPAALDCFDEALRVGRRLGRAELTVEALEGLAQLHLLSNPVAALPPLKEALDLTVEHGLVQFEARVRVNIADVHFALSDPDAARRELNLALENYERFDHPQAASIRARLAAFMTAGEERAGG